MIALKCPSCGANFHIEQMREFAFCSYCGTQIQLIQTVNVVHQGTVNVQGMRSEIQQIEAARRMMNIGEYVTAQSALEKLAREFPDCGEAWLELALCNFKRDLFGDGRTSGVQLQSLNVVHTKVNDPLQIKNTVFAKLRESHAYQVAEKLLGKRQVIGLCGSFINQLSDEMDTALELSARQIARFAANPLALRGYLWSDAESEDRYFFNAHGQLYYKDFRGYYRVDLIQNGAIHMTLMHLTRTPYLNLQGKPHSVIPRRQTLQMLYISTDEKLLRMAGGIIFSKQNPIGNEAYETMLETRRSKRRCPVCGGEQGIFGACKNNCQSWIQ